MTNPVPEITYAENVLSEQTSGQVHDALMSPYFPWYFNDSIANNNGPCPTAFQFTHTFFDKENGWVTASALLGEMMLKEATKKFGIQEFFIVRMKANLLTLSGYSSDISSVHTDSTCPEHRSLLYYVDDSDGCTLILDNEKQNIVHQILPKKNAAILFNSNIWHSSSPPMRSKRRVVVNTIIKV